MRLGKRLGSPIREIEFKWNVSDRGDGDSRVIQVQLGRIFGEAGGLCVCDGELRVGAGAFLCFV